MEPITLQIDGKEVRTDPGATVLKAAQDAGIYIPTLCADPDLEPYGGCRLCVVEIDGVRGQPTSCTTPVTKGMVVRTQTPAVDKIRRTAIELIMSDHPADCLICVKNQKCELQKVAAYFGIDQYKYKRTSRAVPIDSSNPFYERNLNKCILCAKCSRVCNEIRGVGAIDVAFRGFSSVIAAFGNRPVIESNCISCGSCVDKCPVGALYIKNSRRPDTEVASICTYCGVGCGIKLGIRGGKIVSVLGNRESPVNRGYVCAKGRYGVMDVVQHPDRLTSPLIKQGKNFVKASWNEALDYVAAKLASYPKDQVAVIPSAKCTNEDNYVAQKLARAVLGTNNIDHWARLHQAPSLDGLEAAFGMAEMTNSIHDIGDAGCILAIGTDTRNSHPVAAMELWRAASHGRKLVVISSREIDLTRWANLSLRNRPGSELALLMGMVRVIIDEGLEDKPFIQERCENYEVFKASLADFSLDAVENLSNVSKDRIVEAARLFASGKPSSIVYGLGLSAYGAGAVQAAANLALITGNVGKPSAGVNPLCDPNNLQGACDVGALPDALPGYQSVSDSAARAKFEAAWGMSLNPNPGLTLTEILEAAGQKKIKAMYLIGENPILGNPDSRHVAAALSGLDFFVVQDIFLTETAKLAHVVLPGATFAEKDGTFTNTERRVQRVRKAIEPVGDAKPDWWITCQIAKRMQAKGFEFDNPKAIMDEIAKLTPIYGGIDYDRLDSGGLQWPCPTKEHPGTPILHTNKFRRGKGYLAGLKYTPATEAADKDYPLILTTERSAFQYHTGTMIRKIAGLNQFRGQEYVEINPEDAATWGIIDGEKVKVVSRRGEVTAVAKITAVSPPGVVSIECFAKVPELSAVRIERLKI